jgi:pilus assembly protein CpaE
MTAMVERDPAAVQFVRETLSAPVTSVWPLDRVVDHLRRDATEDVVVLGPSVTDEEARAFAEHNMIHRPGLGVIRIRASVDNAVLADAFRAGMSAVVESGDATGLRNAVRRAGALARAVSESRLHAAAEPAPQGLLLTVFATKGGVGKSLVATNLAAALADQGHRVCIVDLDIHGGDVAIMLQLSPVHTLGDLSRIHGGIDVSGVQSLLTEHSDGLSVLAAPVQVGEQVAVEPTGTVLEVLKGMFDVVVVDTSGAFDEYALQALDHTDLLVLVGTLDIPALKSLKLATGTLDLLNFPRDRWRLVLNRADSKVGLSRQEFEETLGISVTVSLPSARDVLTAVNRGETIVRANRGHQVSKTLTSFAASLVRPAAPQQLDAAVPSRRGGLRRGAHAKRVS